MGAGNCEHAVMARAVSDCKLRDYIHLAAQQWFFPSLAEINCEFELIIEYNLDL